MGLASKIAASGGGPQGYGNAPAGQLPQKPAYPGQQQYQAYPGGAPGGYSGQQGQPQPGYPPQGPPQGQYGQGQFGGPPPQVGPAQIQAIKQVLQSSVQQKGLGHFYPPNSSALDQLANRAAYQVDQLCARWRIGREMGNDMAKLGLYDIFLYIDDSGSMQFEEEGERIRDLKMILNRVAYAATLFDDDGISMRFMNTQLDPRMLNNIKSEQQIEQIIQGVQFKGLTPMGTQLQEKVISPILDEIRQNRLKKPVLIITITDGQPAGESQGAVTEAIKRVNQELARYPHYGQNAIAFQFAQVGNDVKAREFLAKLDAHPEVGRLVDCTSNYENESAEMAKGQPPVELTPELWLVKLLLGAIDSTYDRKDEKSGTPAQGGYGAPPPAGQYGAPPPGQYGAPPPGQYGAPPPGQYGAPPPGQYGQPSYGQYGQQPQGQYGQPQYGQQQGQYGRPPQPGGYPGQQQYPPRH